MLLQNLHSLHPCRSCANFFNGKAVGEEAAQKGLVLAEELRNEVSLRLLFDSAGGSFKNQFKRADKSHAKIALIIGDDELQSNTVIVKFLREDKPQQQVKCDELVDFVRNYLLNND